MAQTPSHLHDGIAVAAVIVTHNRVELLRHSLEVVAKQPYPVKHIIVVDNGADPAVAALVNSIAGERGVYTPSRTNLGGGGGFAVPEGDQHVDLVFHEDLLGLFL